MTVPLAVSRAALVDQLELVLLLLQLELEGGITTSTRTNTTSVTTFPSECVGKRRAERASGGRGVFFGRRRCGLKTTFYDGRC